MTKVELIPTTKNQAWRSALEKCPQWDVYHLQEYHEIASQNNEGMPYLFYFENQYGLALLPFLLRSVSEVEGLEDMPHADVHSVYGYPGVLTTVNEEDEEANAFRSDFQQALRTALEEKSVVSFFSRTNPLIPSSWLFRDLAEVTTLSLTVYIDLTQDDGAQLKNMTKGHRYDIRKARKMGVSVVEDTTFSRVDEFLSIYCATMQRVGANDYYFFSRDYYLSLKAGLGNRIRLYFAELDGYLISASIFFFSRDIIQYHLSGTPVDYLKFCGAKVILDEIRVLGSNAGYRYLHLGGGVGSQDDSLLRFKSGFSKLRLPFQIIKWICSPKEYKLFCEKRSRYLAVQGLKGTANGFFPAYRQAFPLCLRAS